MLLRWAATIRPQILRPLRLHFDGSNKQRLLCPNADPRDFHSQSKRQKAEKATKMKVEKPKQRGINNSTLYRVCQQVLNSVTSYRIFCIKRQLYFFLNLSEFFQFLSNCFNLCYKNSQKEFERIFEDSKRIKVAFIIERTVKSNIGVFQAKGNLPVGKLFIALILCSRFAQTLNKTCWNTL